MLFIVLCLLFQSRNIEKVDDQKAILLGVSIGFAVMCAVIVVLEGPVRGLPLLVPPTIATGAIAILSFWSRTKLNYIAQVILGINSPKVKSLKISFSKLIIWWK